MSNQADHTIVRLRVPPELKKQIEDAAEKNNRSQSAEMVARLEQSFSLTATDPEYMENIKNLAAVLEHKELLIQAVELFKKQKDSN